MKLLVFAHSPPPHHGQSYMVQLMLCGFAGDRRQSKCGAVETNPFGIECYHVNARLSTSLQDMGSFSFRKVCRLFCYCLQAVWCRFRYGVTNFYYIPAPGKKGALYRDWFVMALCRPFFRRMIFHWHAAGLSQWLDASNSAVLSWMTRTLMRCPDLSIVLSHHNKIDGQWLGSRRITVVYNGIPDPCPTFETDVLPLRRARLASRQKLRAGETPTPEEVDRSGGDPWLIKLLFLAHCTREKGLFDAIEAVVLANAQMIQSRSRLRYQLTVAGEFIDSTERRAFEERIVQPDSQIRHANEPESRAAVLYAGFLSGEAKNRVLKESDCLCLPTYYHAESFGLVIIEAMAFGLPILTTRWRSIPELFPADYSGLVGVRSPAAIAESLQKTVFDKTGEELRERYQQQFSLSQHLETLSSAIHSVLDTNLTQSSLGRVVSRFQAF